MIDGIAAAELEGSDDAPIGVRVQLAAGADALAEDDEGATPAHAARLRGQFHVVAALESADLAPSLAAQLSGAALGAAT